MQWIGLIFKLIPLVSKLMVLAERAFDDVPESGAQKKQMVMETIRTIVESLSGVVLTADMWTKIEAILSALVDIVCPFLFPKEKA
jgi:lipoate synthase